jgi:hypothetical protein
MTTRPALLLIAPEAASPLTLISAFSVSVRFMRAFGWLMQYRFPSLIGIRAPSFEGWLGEGQNVLMEPVIRERKIGKQRDA